jgi:uncharacterized protein (TIGR04255 family)
LFKIDRRRLVPLPLPPPDRTRLARSPLELVVCQLRFETQPQVADAQVALAVHQALGGADGPYPRLESSGQTVNFTVAPGAEPAVSQQGVAGWRYRSSDGTWIVSVTPDNVALETTRYTTWEDFGQRMRELLDATDAHVGPGIEQRLGLRYIDRIFEVDAGSPADWEPYLIPELLGLALHQPLGIAVKTARQQLLLDLGGGYSCTVNHGFVEGQNSRLNYLLDYDLFREGGRPFSVDDVSETLEVLHEDAGKLFQASITPALYEHLGEPVAEEATT